MTGNEMRESEGGRERDMQQVVTDWTQTRIVFICIISQKQNEGAVYHHAHCATFRSNMSVNDEPPLEYSLNSVSQLSACVGGVNTHVPLIRIERQMLCGSARI